MSSDRSTVLPSSEPASTHRWGRQGAVHVAGPSGRSGAARSQAVVALTSRRGPQARSSDAVAQSGDVCR